MHYREAIAYIIERSGYDRGFVANPFDAETIGLQRTAWLLDALDHPERAYPTIHVAGTKGKGSTAACLAAILRASGRRVGLYTSPHLHTFRERIQIDEEPITPETFAALTAEIAPVNTRLAAAHPAWGEATAFEISTALAFLAFARAGIDVGVIEVGLGGRLDATNVLTPAVSVITPVSLDHTAILGETLEEIAGEKGGIIKPGRPVVIGPQQPPALATLEQIAAERGSPYAVAGRDWQANGTAARFDLHGPWGTYHDLTVALLGQHQVANAATAVAACWELRQQGFDIPEEAIRHGLASVFWPGRLEIVREEPLVLVDGAHNVDSAERLVEALDDTFGPRRRTLILGIAGDKAVESMLAVFAPTADRIIATASHHPRAATAEQIATMARTIGPAGLTVSQAPDVASALDQALASSAPDELICVTGSLYAVSEAREALGLAQADEFERELLFR